jgi:cytosine/adenosine deaminase-related metal-dependent hydrolase
VRTAIQSDLPHPHLPMKSSSWTLTARWIFPVAGPPLEGGVVTIRGERIAAVQPRGARRADLDLGNAAVLPGLVNAHTHLDLTGLRGRCLPKPGQRFTAWLRKVIDHRRCRSRAEIEGDIRDGIAECIRFGTTLVGDISSQGWSQPLLAQSPLRSVVFYELLGLTRPRARQAWTELRAWLQSLPAAENSRPGLSPHAPYSVRHALFRAAVARARRDRLPLATHLAESSAEQELLARHTGELVDFLVELGVWDAGGLVRQAIDVIRLCTAAEHVCLVHANYLGAEASRLRGRSLIFCPRTHAAFGHCRYPLAEYRDNGVRVALGTDSLASNPDLDVLAEVRAVRRAYPEMAGPDLLRMATLAGAEALGWDRETGSLEPGKSADLVVLPLPEQEADDPHALVLESSLPVQAVLFRGRQVQGG